MKAIIDALIITLFIITNCMSVLVLIALSPASTFGKIITSIFEIILFVEAIKCLEESA